jgi:hypothetical protein
MTPAISSDALEMIVFTSAVIHSKIHTVLATPPINQFMWAYSEIPSCNTVKTFILLLPPVMAP